MIVRKVLALSMPDTSTTMTRIRCQKCQLLHSNGSVLFI